MPMPGVGRLRGGRVRAVTLHGPSLDHGELGLSARLLVVSLLCSSAAWAQQVAETWLTIVGTPDNPALNTIQVDPASIEREEDLRSMRIRVSRSTQRTSWDGVTYRSYEARVQIDCRDHSARYKSITFYAQPTWRGSAHRTVDYSKGSVRAMAFKDVVPNPNQRIIYAACAAER